MDARIAAIKNSFLVVVNSGQNVSTAEEMKAAMESYTGKQVHIFTEVVQHLKTFFLVWLSLIFFGRLI